jgi:Flp pilus assembly protein TadG
MKRLRNDRGSVLVMVVLMFTGLMAIGGITLDVGSWYTAKRKLQSTADAAALAAAQDLPNTTTAGQSATSYANLNNSGLNSWTPSFPNTYTIDISLSKSAPSYFSSLVGVSGKTVHAHSRALVGTPTQLNNVLPVAVNVNVACKTDSTGCFNLAKTLTFDDSTTVSFSSSSWGLMDPSGQNTSTTTCQGQASESNLASWVTTGYPGTLSTGTYDGAVNGQKQAIQNALNTQIGKVLLIPVFDTASQSWCQNPAKGGFHVVGWAAFVIDQSIPNSDWTAHVKKLHGHFTTYLAHSVPYTPGYNGFGVKVVALNQ